MKNKTNEILKKLLAFSGLDLLAIIFILIIGMGFFLVPLQRQVLDANEAIQRNTLRLEELPLEEALEAQESLEGYHTDILWLFFGFAGAAMVILTLCSAYSWSAVAKTKFSFGHFIIRYLTLNMAWFGAFVVFTLLLLGALAFRDVLGIGMLYDAAVAFVAFCAAVVLGYLYVQTVIVVAQARWKKYVPLRRYLIASGAVVLFIILMSLLPGLMILPLSLIGIVLLNVLKMYVAKFI